jgi:hypothetical protein
MWTSAWVRERTVWQPAHSPQPTPSRSHCSAAANARAATERPEPGGPVNSQACVIELAAAGSPATTRCAAAADSCKVATARG